MGQTEGKPIQHQNAEAAEAPPTSPNIPVPTSQHTEDTPQDANKNENLSSTPNTNTPPSDGRVSAVKTNAEVLKRSTDELVGGINKLGANLISTAKGAVPYTSYSMNAFKKAASAAVEDAIVTVKAGIVRTEEEPELEAVAKMALFFPLIRSSVPISDLAKGLPAQKTTISYLDPKSILVSLLDYQRFLVVTSKMIAGRQAEVNTKMKEVEMSSGRKTVFTLAMKVTDMRHFNTQFSEVSRFHSNMERTKQSINDILGMFEKLNAILPTEHQLDSFSVFAAPNPHSSINFASLNLPSSHSSGSFALQSSHSSGNLANYTLPSSHSSGSLANYNFPSSHSSGKFSSLNPPASHSSMKFSTPTTNNPPSTTTTSNTTNANTTNTYTNNTNINITTTNITSTDSTNTNNDISNSDSTNSDTTNLDATNSYKFGHGKFGHYKSRRYKSFGRCKISLMKKPDNICVHYPV
eukprot:Phypoly_transcript_08387.p1 GENE.Phypoly_transcript_08387~~Phypoly_transcript_08387.p1  ORF type:complete len:465 (+),score=96.75 Phypoly_transcript_08387:73-1467(+)